MKYEAEDFEILKKHVEEFLKKGPMGDIYLYFFLEPYPYNQTEDALDTLRFADVRKVLVDFLRGVSQSYSPEAGEQTKCLIQEIQEYGYPDRQEEDSMKCLAWKLCSTMKFLDYKEWDSRRLPGESEADVVRRTYQQMKSLEYCSEQLEFWQEYTECRHLRYEEEIQAAEIIVELQGLFPSLPKAEFSKEEVMIKCRDRFESHHVKDTVLYYILEAADSCGNPYKGLARYNSDMVSFSTFEESAWFLHRNDTLSDNDLLGTLENGYEISFMTMDGHAAVWYELGTSDIRTISHKEGLEKYLLYCKENDITARTIKETMGYTPPDLMGYLMPQKKETIPEQGRQKKR